MDAITLLLYMFFGFVLLIVILIGIAFLKAIFGIRPAPRTQTNSKITEKRPQQEEDNRLEEDTREDSEGDGLMLFDDPMFPPEIDDEEDDF